MSTAGRLYVLAERLVVLALWSTFLDVAHWAPTDRKVGAKVMGICRTCSDVTQANLLSCETVDVKLAYLEPF